MYLLENDIEVFVLFIFVEVCIGISHIVKVFDIIKWIKWSTKRTRTLIQDVTVKSSIRLTLFYQIGTDKKKPSEPCEININAKYSICFRN